jgi:hypothetical protein
MKLDHQRSSARKIRGLRAATSSWRPLNIPRRKIVRHAYHEAIRNIEEVRCTHQFGNDFHQRIADAVFDACYSALEHFAAWLDERGPADKATQAELRDGLRTRPSSNSVSPRLHVVSAPMGLGKTTFTTAFIVAMVRLSETSAIMFPGT